MNLSIVTSVPFVYINIKAFDTFSRAYTENSLQETYDKHEFSLFSSVEIEIINRCNGECSFCPVNRYTDPRRLKRMDSQLPKINYHTP